MKKIFGTTLLLGEKELETIYGKFVAIVFQDIILKTYVLALLYENTWKSLKENKMNDSVLYIRIHSSCVTSEMLCSQDCDCVEQLFGAMNKISEMKNGILFYLIQEGRGCGYISKARACQLVQYDEIKGKGNITTFEAYKMLGLKYDYRSYHNIKEIIEILNLGNSKFVLLTNNPDKINGLKNLNINIVDHQNIEFKPNPFNISYLVSKGKYGHDLHLLEQQKNYYNLPFEPIKPFELRHLEKYSRFIYVASYYLPIKNVYDWFYLPNIDKSSELYNKIKNSKHPLNENLFSVSKDIKEKYNVYDPLWFRVHLFYDITTNLDYVVLEYQEISKKNTIPLIRIHSESIFDRFPLTNRVYHEKFKMSILDIIINGFGYILLFYRDGRGSGLGYYLLNKDENDLNSNINKENIGIPDDTRDYDAILQLIEHMLSQTETKNCKLINSTKTIDKISNKLNKYEIVIEEKILIDQGYYTILERINKVNYYINRAKEFKTEIKLNKSIRYIVSGIGSSLYHSLYMDYLLNKNKYDSRFESVLNLYHNTDILDKKLPIYISQGLSPTIKKLLNKTNNSIVITANTKYNLSNCCNQILYIPHDIPDNTLARIIGPIMCFIYILKIFNIDYERRNLITNPIFFNKNNNYYLICSNPNDKWLGIISNYLLELYCINVIYCGDFLNFAHGPYQISLTKENNFFLCFTNKNDTYLNLVSEMLKERNTIINIHSENDEMLCIMDWIISILNSVFYNINELKEFDHNNWPGKYNQRIIYEY